MYWQTPHCWWLTIRSSGMVLPQIFDESYEMAINLNTVIPGDNLELLNWVLVAVTSLQLAVWIPVPLFKIQEDKRGFGSIVWRNPAGIPKHPLHHLKEQKCHKSKLCQILLAWLKGKNTILVVKIGFCLGPLSKQKIFLELEEDGVFPDDCGKIISCEPGLCKMRKTCLACDLFPICKSLFF